MSSPAASSRPVISAPLSAGLRTRSLPEIPSYLPGVPAYNPITGVHTHTPGRREVRFSDDLPSGAAYLAGRTPRLPSFDTPHPAR